MIHIICVSYLLKEKGFERGMDIQQKRNKYLSLPDLLTSSSFLLSE